MKEVLAKQPAISGFTQLQATLCGRQLTFEIPASWTAGPSSSGTDGDGFEFTSWGGLTDPVLGVIAVEVTLRAKRVPGEVTSVRDLCAGKAQADVLPVQAFGLGSAVPELVRSDIMRAGARVGSVPVSAVTQRRADDAGSGAEGSSGQGSDPLFWEWELAVPPETCAYNTGCNSAAVHFVSLVVTDGVLCWMDLKLTDESAYRNAAGQIRRARTSFTSESAPVAPPPRGASQAEAAVIVAAP